MSKPLSYQTVIDSSLRADQIGLPQPLAKECSIQPGERIWVQVSTRSELAFVTQFEARTIRLSPSLADRLHFPGGRVSIQVRNRTIRLGPILSVYAVGSAENERPFPNMTRLLADTIRLGDELGLYVYVITPGTLDFCQRTAYGARLNGGKWKWERQPFPDIVFQKTVLFPKPLYHQVRWEVKQFENDPHVRVFGKDIGDKWDVYNLLRKHGTDIKGTLPDTRIFREPREIWRLLKTYTTVYVKPAKGTQGSGIFRVSRSGGSPPKLSIETVGGSNNQSTYRRTQQRTLHSQWLEKNVRQFVKKRRRYLVQQGIELLTDQGRILDFRWLVQKLVNEKWDVTARICRIAKARQIATNLHKGGQAIPAEEMLKKFEARLGKRASDQLQTMDRLAIEVAEILDAYLGGNLEFGIDFALDNRGKVWFLEANPRPGRKMLRLCQPEIRKQSLLRPLEYAKYATGFVESE
jgi:hypothetical protein